jgi:RNA polymerase sigma factor (sigma-70 family)
MESAAEDVSHVVEHLFRHEFGKMVATLTRIFGLNHLSLAEDVVQEALARAMQTLPFYGIPQNPAAWIMRASRNLALDVVRRESTFKGKEAEVICAIEQASSNAGGATLAEDEITDDRLRLMFVCCHPLIPPEAQIALALKTLCGFSPAEIAKAFLTSEAAVHKRLTRAKQKIRELQIRFEMPEGEALAHRLDGVLQSLYLLFNEGYKASTGDHLVRADVCHEAIRLTQLLAAHPAGCQPRTHALLALMLLNTARIDARVDAKGSLLRLQDQDRTRWNRALIGEGMFHLAQSATGQEVSQYHLEAGIAACHCAAREYAATNWKRILELYDELCTLDRSPVVALNRAVAVAQVSGPRAGLAAVAAIPTLHDLEGYYLLHAVLGDLEARLERFDLAAAHFHKALQLAQITSEKEFLNNRLEACRAHTSS